MDFSHTTDRQMLADTIARFAADQYGFPTRLRAAEAPLGYDEIVWDGLVGLGTLGALFDDTVGGFGGSGFDLMVVFEQVGRSLLLEPFLPALMVGKALIAAGASRDLVEEIATGTRVAFAHDEPGRRYATQAPGTRARRDGEDWIIDGAKSVVAQAESAHAVLVSASVDGADGGTSLFLVPRDATGLGVRGYANVDGGRSADLSFDGVRVTGDARVADGTRGAQAIHEAQAAGLLALCAEAVGAMDVARDMTVEYLRTRQQFGVPIGTFQALQHRVATLLIDIEQARSSVINAAAATDGDDPVARDRALSAAKYTIGRVGTLVAEEAIQLHGGIGMTWELPLPHYAKRLVMIGHQLGDEDHHLQRFIALGAA